MKELVACFALISFPALANSALVSVNDVQNTLLAAKPEYLKPTCLPGFEKCAQHLKTIEPMFESLQNNWLNFTSVECVSRALSNGFPSNAWDCWKNGEFGHAMSCMLSSEVTKLFGQHEDNIKALVKCFLDNAPEGDKKQQHVV